MGANDPRSVATLDPRGMVGRIYVGDHQILPHTIPVGSSPHDFTEKKMFEGSIAIQFYIKL